MATLEIACDRCQTPRETATNDTTLGDHDTEWRQLLTGEIKGMTRARRILGRIPRGERCKVCNAPFGAPGGLVLRLIGLGRSRLNPWICRVCVRDLEKHPGGAEVEVSLLFVDLRGSTALGESQSPSAYRELINRFYGAAATSVNHWDGVVDKFVGDEVVAMFIPGLTGNHHAQAAIESGRELLRRTGHGSNDGPWAPAGGAVHTGVAFVGTSGHDDVLDFTALGDPVNVTARLASEAGVGELLVSRNSATAAHIAPDAFPARTLDLRGRQEPVEVVVLGP